MSIAYWCVLAAALLPYITVGVAKRLGSYDNRNPRSPEAYSGIALRADGAHKNGFEAFAFFGVAVLVASGADPRHTFMLLDVLALAWIVLRLGYTAAYIGDRATLRSMLWLIGWALTVAIFTMPAWHLMTAADHPL